MSLPDFDEITVFPEPVTHTHIYIHVHRNLRVTNPLGIGAAVMSEMFVIQKSLNCSVNLHVFVQKMCTLNVYILYGCSR